MEYIKVSQAAQKWGLSPRRVRLLCAQNRIDGVVKKGKLYMIPWYNQEVGWISDLDDNKLDIPCF